MSDHITEIAGIVSLIMLIVSGAFSMGTLWNIVRTHSRRHDGHDLSIREIKEDLHEYETQLSAVKVNLAEQLATLRQSLVAVNDKLDRLIECGCNYAKTNHTD